MSPHAVPSYLRPRALPSRGNIGVVALSGRVDPHLLDRAVAALTASGHRVSVAAQARNTWRYFSGSDAERVAALHEMLADPEIDMILAARGGYGVSRLLARIDWSLVERSDQIICGFSDFTAFSLAALARTRRITFAGPMATADFAGERQSAFTSTHFWGTLQSMPHGVERIESSSPYQTQLIEGTAWGGNLSLLAHLVGTPYFPQVDGGVLFVEDVAEEAYRIERMLLQLLHAGVLTSQRAILLGAFTATEPRNPTRYHYSLAEVVETLREYVNCPVLTDLPFGHVPDKLTIPIGATARIALDPGGYALSFHDYLENP